MGKRKNLYNGFCIFKGYNWCGPGCSGPEPPVNTVDAACKAHDECYDKYGPSCKCDEIFIKQLSSKIDENTCEGRHARLLYKAMKLKMLFTCNRF